MGIPKKALRHSQFITKKPISDGSHKIFSVSFEEDGVTKKAFFKELEPERHYPELLAKISVATSSFKKSFQGSFPPPRFVVYTPRLLRFAFIIENSTFP